MRPHLLIEILGTVNERILSPDPLMVSVRTTEERILVGRRPDMRINAGMWLYLANPTVSPCHALIFFKEDAWCIRDLGSENGTWVYNDSPHPEYIRGLAIHEKLEVVFGHVVARLTVQKQYKE
jgi:pSer/pThr/pTyr-binding forkhead associated (FHA) protein